MSRTQDLRLLQKAIHNDAIRKARADAERGRKDLSVPSPWCNDWYDSQSFESSYEAVYDEIAEEVRKEKAYRKREEEERKREREMEAERWKNMTPEERSKETQYLTVGTIIAIILAFYFYRAIFRMLFSPW